MTLVEAKAVTQGNRITSGSARGGETQIAGGEYTTAPFIEVYNTALWFKTGSIHSPHTLVQQLRIDGQEDSFQGD
ncbi:MAG TPA: hypothetical protein VFQ43_07670 [Nitrososphaera sp.]|nr:hypothetical protein [Nitrososphaera sp.]